MIAREILNNQLLPLHYHNTGEEAMMAMHELNVSQMPVIDEEEYVGIISIEEILFLKHLNEPLSAIHKTLRKPHVTENSHLFDVMKAALAYNTKIIPILSDGSNKYLGVISAESCLKSFSELNSIIDEGGILEVVIPLNDFVLSDVVRAIELNDVKVLALYTNINQSKGIVEVTVKTNSNDLAASIASLERYGFEIKGYYHEQEYSEDLKDRYDALIHFLNV